MDGEEVEGGEEVLHLPRRRRQLAPLLRIRAARLDQVRWKRETGVEAGGPSGGGEPKLRGSWSWARMSGKSSCQVDWSRSSWSPLDSCRKGGIDQAHFIVSSTSVPSYDTTFRNDKRRTP